MIIGEPKIDLSKIDCSRNLDEMGSEEQMKVQELMWNHQQKLMGKPTSEQIVSTYKKLHNLSLRLSNNNFFSIQIFVCRKWKGY